MKKRVLLIISVVLILIGISLLVKVIATTFTPEGKGALQVTTNIRAQVFLDDKPIGTTPVSLLEGNKTIRSGTHQIKIVPDDNTLPPYSLKVDINPGVLTAVDKTFLPGSLASVYILTLEKNNKSEPEIFIASIPDGALVTIDGESKGATPFEQKLTASEHEVEIEKTGFVKKTVRVRAVKSYKLILNVVLGAEGNVETTPAASSAPEEKTVTPTLSDNTIVIKNTPTGFLRVRQTPSTAAPEIGRVTPGESYEFTDENDSWYKIVLSDGASGWISKTYAGPPTQ